MSWTRTPRSTPGRAAVVLYECTAGPPALHAMDALRCHATARHWLVHAELHDTTPTIHRELRPGWQRVAELLESGAVEGVIAPHEHQISEAPRERTQLRAWLLDLGAFAVYPMPQYQAVTL